MTLQKLLERVTKFLTFSGLAFVTGFLGAFSGTDKTSLLWRRIGIPVIFTMCALCSLKVWYSIFIMTMSAFLSMGYGVPDHEGIMKNLRDEGSTLGKFWYKITSGSHYWTDILTRGTIGLGISLSLLPIPIYKGNWFFYILGSIGIILTWSFISWRGLGQSNFYFNKKNYKLNNVDLLIYGILGTISLFLIFN